MSNLAIGSISNLGDFLGKHVEIDLSLPYPIQAANTYKNFCLKNEDGELVFYDGNIDEDCQPQELKVSMSDIKNIEFLEGENVYQSVFSIVLNDNSKIDICVYESPVKCICGKIINTPEETVWELSGIGNYGSIFDGEKFNLAICDSCFAEIIGFSCLIN